jgi:hypothetical protein
MGYYPTLHVRTLSPHKKKKKIIYQDFVQLNWELNSNVQTRERNPALLYSYPPPFPPPPVPTTGGHMVLKVFYNTVYFL